MLKIFDTNYKYYLKLTLENPSIRKTFKDIMEIVKERNSAVVNPDEKYAIVLKSDNGTEFEWYITEWDEENKMFFGYASLFHDHNDEWGYIPEEDLIFCKAHVIPHSGKEMKDHRYYNRS